MEKRRVEGEEEGRGKGGREGKERRVEGEEEGRGKGGREGKERRVEGEEEGRGKGGREGKEEGRGKGGGVRVAEIREWEEGEDERSGMLSVDSTSYDTLCTHMSTDTLQYLNSGLKYLTETMTIEYQLK